MEIKTKYNVGQHIWCVNENKTARDIEVYDDIIESIVIDEDRMYYATKETYDEIREEDIIAYDDEKALVDKIYKTMQEIRGKEKE